MTSQSCVAASWTHISWVAPSGSSVAQPRSLALSLARLRRRAPGSDLSLAEISAALGERSGLLLTLFLSVIAMLPSPGLPIGVIFGFAVIVLAVGVIPGRNAVPLPRRIGAWKLPRGVLDSVLRRVVPTLRRVERRLRPRARWAVCGAGALAAAVMMMIQGVLLALPIPFGNAVPGLAIAMLALGLLTEDGLGVLAGHALGLAAAGMLVVLAVGGYAVVSGA